MAKRYTIGLIYSYNNNWIAGAYYILNLIQAIQKLTDVEKPILVIITNTEEEFLAVKRITSYPYLKFAKINESDLWPSYRLIERIINKIARLFIKRDIFYREFTYKRFSEKIDLLFPADENNYFSNVKNKLFWIPDFQEHFLPTFFSEKQITSRQILQNKLVHLAEPIVFSSQDALGHFRKLYPAAESKVFVLSFAVTHADYTSTKISQLTTKYEIKHPYFFCANQFWAHKNHITLLKAIRELKVLHPDILVVFSGKELDSRNPEFFKSLQMYIVENNMQNNVKFLGFIDREEQLQLMNNAIAIVQPSLFEGWSTVIEDAKAMNQLIIASNIPVNQEQVVENAIFFEPLNHQQLANILKNFLTSPPLKTKTSDYSSNVEKFGKQFMHIAKQLIENRVHHKN